jgi:uncharacterized protein
MSDPTLLIEMTALLLVIGAVAGVLAGLLGVGGGIVLVPAFYFTFAALGFDTPWLMQVCLGTSLATIIVTSTRSLLLHNRKGAVDWDNLRRWAPGIAAGAVVGVLVAARLKTTALLLIFGGFAGIVGLYMSFGRDHWRLAAQLPRGPLAWVMSALLGCLSVVMGIGGGTFGVPLQTLFGVPIHRAVATASGFGISSAVPAVIGFLLFTLPAGAAPPLTLGAVNLAAFGLVIGMSLLTTPYGVRLAHWMDPKPLKRLFGGFLIIVALNMLRKAFGW